MRFHFHRSAGVPCCSIAPRSNTEHLYVFVCVHLVALPSGLLSLAEALSSIGHSELIGVEQAGGGLLLLTGEGGTGKSRVTTAIQHFARCWNRSLSVMVMATTGVGAAALGAWTVRAGLGINPANNLCSAAKNGASKAVAH